MVRRRAAAVVLIAVISACAGDREPVVRRTGKPALRTAALDQALFSALPRLVIAANQPGGEFDAARQQLASSCSQPARICLGLAEIASALSVARSASRADRDGARSMMTAARRRLNRALAAHDAGYVVDTELAVVDDQPVILVMSFEVEDVLGFRTGPNDYRALLVRRRDGLNWSYQLLGFTSARADEALVLLDTIDADLLDLYATDDSSSSVRRATLARELEGAGLADFERVVRSYHRHWRQLSDRAELQALVSLGTPASIPTPGEVLALAARVLDPAELRDFRQVGDELARHPALPRLRRHHAVRIAIHEVQHLIDADRGTPVARATEPNDPEGDATGAELSAYLAELAHSSASARSSLARLLEFATSEQVGHAESWAARHILESIASELGISSPMEASAWNPPSLDPAALTRAAKAHWTRVFGRPLAALRGPT